MKVRLAALAGGVMLAAFGVAHAAGPVPHPPAKAPAPVEVSAPVNVVAPAKVVAPVAMAAPVTVAAPLAAVAAPVAAAAADAAPGTALTPHELIIARASADPTRTMGAGSGPLGGTAGMKLPNAAIPSQHDFPFTNYLLGAGQYVLEVGTLSQQPRASKSSAVPLPGAIWLLGTGLLAFLAIAVRHKL